MPPRTMSPVEALSELVKKLDGPPETCQIDAAPATIKELFRDLAIESRKLGVSVVSVDLAEEDATVGPAGLYTELESRFRAWLSSSVNDIGILALLRRNNRDAAGRRIALLADASSYDGEAQLVYVKKRIRILNEDIGELGLHIFLAVDPRRGQAGPIVVSDLATGWLRVESQ